MLTFRGSLISVLLSFAFFACGGMTADAPSAITSNAKVSLELPNGVSLKPGGAIASANPKLNAAKITAIGLKVTASDLASPITGTIPLDTLLLDVEIPSGSARTFTITVSTDAGFISAARPPWTSWRGLQ